MTRVTLIVGVWLLLVGSIADSAASPGSPHRPLELLGLYVLVSALALAAVWLHLSPDQADDAAPRRQPFRWD